jgi:hypothetical protein
MDQLVSVLQQAGGTMEFSAFVAAARQAGARPELWIKAKHAGLLHVVILTDGSLSVRAGAQPAQGGA